MPIAASPTAFDGDLHCHDTDVVASFAYGTWSSTGLGEGRQPHEAAGQAVHVGREAERDRVEQVNGPEVVVARQCRPAEEDCTPAGT